MLPDISEHTATQYRLYIGFKYIVNIGVYTSFVEIYTLSLNLSGIIWFISDIDSLLALYWVEFRRPTCLSQLVMTSNIYDICDSQIS